MIRTRSISPSVTINLLAAASGIFAAFLIVPPDIAAPHIGLLRHLVIAALALGLALWLPSHLFLGASVAVLATSSAIGPVSVGPVQFYTYDMMFALVLFRAALPRARRVSDVRILDPALSVPIALWTAVMLVAGARGSLGGNSLGAIARLETPLVYFPAFCWGFTRILREKSVSVPRVVRAVAVTSLGLIGYAAWARLTHHRFGNPSGSGIGIVPTTAGDLRRDYGFFSAFQVYPLLALGGIAYLLFSRRHKLTTTLVAGAGLSATLLTLVRGLIFGVVAGAVWLVVLAVRTRWPVRLGLRLLPLGALFAIAGALLFTFNPVAARGVTERILPGVLPQSQVATGSTDYRVHALKAAVHIAWNHPFGLGFLTPDALESAGYPPLYIPHTHWGALLVYTGWPGVLVLAWAGVAVVRRSFRIPAAAPWVHPLVVATSLLVLVQGFAWDVLFSQTWSLGMIALILAFRLGLGPEPRSESSARTS